MPASDSLQKRAAENEARQVPQEGERERERSRIYT